MSAHLTAIASMSRAELIGAWFAHFVVDTSDPEARAAIIARMQRDGITPRQMADAAHTAGLIGDDVHASIAKSKAPD